MAYILTNSSRHSEWFARKPCTGVVCMRKTWKSTQFSLFIDSFNKFSSQNHENALVILLVGFELATYETCQNKTSDFKWIEKVEIVCCLTFTSN